MTRQNSKCQAIHCLDSQAMACSATSHDALWEVLKACALSFLKLSIAHTLIESGCQGKPRSKNKSVGFNPGASL